MDRASHLVAITRLATAIEDEARALAADLGTLAYEERLKLAAGMPAIVLATAEAARAQALAGKLSARGHGVFACRAGDVVAAGAMVSMRRFQLEPDAIVAGDARLPWQDLALLVRATHRQVTEAAATTTEKKFSLGRTIATGGLSMRKTVTKDAIARTEQSEPVLYLFRASGETPWLLREQGTHYGALGADVAPVAARNFALVVERLRAAAPHARYEDRLLARKVSPDDLDVLAHVLAHAR